MAKYSPEITERICEAIRKGYRPVDAAKLFNIGKSTYYDWINDERKPEFSDAIKNRPHTNAHGQKEFAMKRRGIKRRIRSGEYITAISKTVRNSPISNASRQNQSVKKASENSR